MSDSTRTPVTDAWEEGDPYEQYVGRWSRRVAPRFLSWLQVPAGRRWLDVGCGTGALSAAIVDHCMPAAVLSVDPSEGFLSAAAHNLAGRVTLQQGTAQKIPLEDEAVDVVVSGLVLNFVPDPRAALAEMARVTASGGVIGAYVWDYAEKMEMMRIFWNAVIELDPAATELDEAARFPLCRPGPLAELFASSGLTGTDVTAIEVPTRFANFDEYWSPFLGGQGPAPTYAMSLDDTQRTRLHDRIREQIPVEPDGSIVLRARAWAVRGIVSR